MINKRGSYECADCDTPIDTLNYVNIHHKNVNANIFFDTMNLNFTFYVLPYHTHHTLMYQTHERLNYIHCHQYNPPPHYNVLFTHSIFYIITLISLICTRLMSVLNMFTQIKYLKCYLITLIALCNRLLLRLKFISKEDN